MTLGRVQHSYLPKVVVGTDTMQLVGKTHGRSEEEMQLVFIIARTVMNLEDTWA